MKTVLLVENSQFDQRLIESLQKDMGLKVALVETAEAALNWLTTQEPDLILLDPMMPGTNGLDLCRQVRKIPKYKHIPIIFCSSAQQEIDRFWALRQGGNAYITKPFLPKDFIQTISQYLVQAIPYAGGFA